MSTLPGCEIEVVREGANIVGESAMRRPIERVLYRAVTRRPAPHRLNRDRTVRAWPMPTNIGSTAPPEGANVGWPPGLEYRPAGGGAG